ncbi:hypothetical protein N0V82_005895 [Gnomoniopsis sp. IMI 355080]|nr:hypothetical protein N0V82_005895 [Gnomoniopsis sp. IMI 355080]
MAAQSFHCFPGLPRELRDEIWRLCLPHRVVELDLPDQQYLKWCFEDRYCQSYPDLDNQSRRSCELWPTSRRNHALPTIARVCRESRQIAFEAADFAFLEYIDSLSTVTDMYRPWVDFTRDTIHLHWHPCLTELAPSLEAGPRQHRLGLIAKFHKASICADLLDSVYQDTRREIMDVLEKRPSWSICGAYVWIHATDEAAITKSGLWGSLGEERIVLVDARDAKRMASYRSFWKIYGTEEDMETKAFFDACIDDVPKIHYLETPTEFLQDLQSRWLHDRIPYADDHPNQRQFWRVLPADFDGRADDPRQADQGDLPGRPFRRQLWSPNLDHPWVQEVLGRMPEFQPTVMFRLCTNNCRSQERDVDRDDVAQ